MGSRHLGHVGTTSEAQDQEMTQVIVEKRDEASEGRERKECTREENFKLA